MNTFILSSDERLVWKEMKELQFPAHGVEGTSHIIPCGTEAKATEKISLLSCNFNFPVALNTSYVISSVLSRD